LGFGIEPIFQVLSKTREAKKTFTQIYLIPFRDTLEKSLDIAILLRKGGFNVEIDLMNRNVSKNLDYADKKGIKFAVIAGKKELEEKKVLVKNLESGSEEKVPVSRLAKYFDSLETL